MNVNEFKSMKRFEVQVGIEIFARDEEAAQRILYDLIEAAQESVDDDLDGPSQVNIQNDLLEPYEDEEFDAEQYLEDMGYGDEDEE